jgi:hypothetical protein
MTVKPPTLGRKQFTRSLQKGIGGFSLTKSMSATVIAKSFFHRTKPVPRFVSKEANLVTTGLAAA